MSILELGKLFLATLMVLAALMMLPACETSEESEEQCIPYPDCLHWCLHVSTTSVALDCLSSLLGKDFLNDKLVLGEWLLWTYWNCAKYYSLRCWRSRRWWCYRPALRTEESQVPATVRKAIGIAWTGAPSRAIEEREPYRTDRGGDGVGDDDGVCEQHPLTLCYPQLVATQYG